LAAAGAFAWAVEANLSFGAFLTGAVLFEAEFEAGFAEAGFL